MLTRPRLAHPFTIVPHGDAVWLVAGEDVRFTLRAERAAEWLPDVLRGCDGTRELDAIVALAPAPRRAEVRDVIADLAGERAIVDGGPELAPQRAASGFVVEGDGRLAEVLRARQTGGANAIRVVAQDDLDLRAALAAGARHRAEAAPWMWVTIGPVARAYVGPLLVPDAGPCLACILERFRLLSPAPEIYDVLVGHDGPFVAAPISDRAVEVVAAVATWKLAQVGVEPAVAALYALHVVEAASLEVSSHRVFRDPECRACRGT
jgi:bacteriocin biosynthesis cyclodehydratase domain-containing protein